MHTISYDKLLLKTAFCCMASDGNIDVREITLIKSMCEKSGLFAGFNFESEINALVAKINADGRQFIRSFFSYLQKANLQEDEELTLIDFAVQTIKADEHIDYSEIRMFKVIRHSLKVSNERILNRFPEIEQFLEEDIMTGSYLEKVTDQYFSGGELPQFAQLDISSRDTARDAGQL